MFFLRVFNPVFRKNIFIGEKPFWSPLVAHYLSKSIQKNAKREFNRQAYIYLENGYKIKAFRDADRLLDRIFPQIKHTFRNAREYIKHYTSISDVLMKDFTFVYLFYIAWSLILLVFALSRLTRRSLWLPIMLISSSKRHLKKAKVHLVSILSNLRSIRRSR